MKTTEIKPTKKHARKIIELLKFGLTSGIGNPEPGQMCVEACVNYALGLPHSDSPPCVGYAVRDFKIKLNDCAWSSDSARAEGMKKLAIAQLGSDTINQMQFGKTMYLRGVQKILPVIWEALMGDFPKGKQDGAKALIKKMRSIATFKGAERITKDASAYASAASAYYASAYYASASTSAYYASTSAYASACASAYASASASASAYYASASAKLRENDILLRLAADVALEVLIEMNSPGCKWLDLCEASGA